MDEVSVKKNVREIRLSLHLSQQEMADRLGVSRTAYRNFENGRTRVFSEYVSKLAEISGKTEEEIVFGAEAGAMEGILREGMDCDARIRALTDEYEQRLQAMREEMEHLRELIRSKDQSLRLQEQLLGIYARKSAEND